MGSVFYLDVVFKHVRAVFATLAEAVDAEERFDMIAELPRNTAGSSRNVRPETRSAPVRAAITRAEGGALAYAFASTSSIWTITASTSAYSSSGIRTIRSTTSWSAPSCWTDAARSSQWAG